MENEPLDYSRPVKATRVGMSSVDELLDDLKKRGRGFAYQTKEKRELLRQEWISIIVHNVLKEF